jgi:RNA polymerase sigma-70 factor (ECF subfamily)
MTLFRDRPWLLATFREGDRKALEEVYWAYVDRIERLVQHGFLLTSSGVRVRGLPASERSDLIQEIFARAFSDRARVSYDGLREYGPYLATIARNVLVDDARRRGREISLEAVGALPEALPADETDYADPDTLRVVEAYLSQLDPDLRAVHEERYVHGRLQYEAAMRLQISRQQLRTREQRLRQGLARALKAAKLEP